MDEVVGRLTPFMLFYTEHRDAVKARINNNGKHSNNSNNDNGNATKQQSIPRPEEISKEVARLWRTLDPERTKDYCLLANLYAESLVKHGSATGAGRGNNANNGSGGKRKLGKRRLKKDPKLPKLPASAFMWFSRHHRTIMKNDNRDLSFCDIGKAIGALWKAAPAAEKTPFEDLAAEDKARYTRELAAYKAWLVKTQGSKVNQDAVASAAATAAATQKTGVATMAGTAVPKAATMHAAATAQAAAAAVAAAQEMGASSGNPPASANLVAGVAAPAPAQEPLTKAGAGVMATNFVTALPPYSSAASFFASTVSAAASSAAASAAAASAAAAAPASLSPSILPSSSSSTSSCSRTSSPPPPPISLPPMKRMKRESAVFGAASVVAVAPAVSEAVLEVVTETRVGVSHRTHNGGVRGDTGMVAVSSALSPHCRI